MSDLNSRDWEITEWNYLSNLESEVNKKKNLFMWESSSILDDKQENPEQLAYEREMVLLEQRRETAFMEASAEMKKIERIKLELELLKAKS